jgi:hypothetical protein
MSANVSLSKVPFIPQNYHFSNSKKLLGVDLSSFFHFGRWQMASVGLSCSRLGG